MTLGIGPYMNGEGDWWVPVESASFRKARATVVACLDYTIEGEFRLAYVGKTMALLGDEIDPMGWPRVLAYHFEERRPW